MSQDLAGDCRKPVVAVRKAKHAGVKRESVRQQKRMQKLGDPAGGVFGDQSRKVRPVVFYAVPDRRSRANKPLYFPMCDASFLLTDSRAASSKCLASNLSRRT